MDSSFEPYRSLASQCNVLWLYVFRKLLPDMNLCLLNRISVSTKGIKSLQACPKETSNGIFKTSATVKVQVRNPSPHLVR
jgi:hypothetical protein